MKNKILLIVFTVFLVGLLYVFMLPYKTLHQVKTGFKNYDAELINKNIDYPRLKQSINDQALAVVKKILGDMRDSGDVRFKDADSELAIFTLGQELFKEFLNLTITPENLAATLEKASSQPDAGRIYDPAKTKITGGYVSINQFNVTVMDIESKTSFLVVLNRQGLTWYITELNFPQNVWSTLFKEHLPN